MNVLFCGSGQFGVPCLDAILASNHQLSCILTQPAQPAGRGKKLRHTPVALWAQKNNICSHEAPDINTDAMLEMIASCYPDLMVVIAFGQKISPEAISIAKHGAINVHASLLPKYRGAAPINWAIINGETETGVSIITLAQKMDAGFVLAQAATPIGTHETATDLHDRLSHLAAPVLIDTINKVEAGTAIFTPQDDAIATRAPKLKKSDGFIDWSEPADRICNKIRGLWAWPEAESFYVNKKTGRCERVIMAQCKVVQAASQKFTAPGMLDENLNVVCGKDAVKITLIKPAGSDLMDFKAFANGRATAPGDLFMQIEQQAPLGTK